MELKLYEVFMKKTNPAYWNGDNISFWAAAAIEISEIMIGIVKRSLWFRCFVLFW